MNISFKDEKADIWMDYHILAVPGVDGWAHIKSSYPGAQSGLSITIDLQQKRATLV